MRTTATAVPRAQQARTADRHARAAAAGPSEKKARGLLTVRICDMPYGDHELIKVICEYRAVLSELLDERRRAGASL